MAGATATAAVSIVDLEVTPWLYLSHALIGLLGYVTGMMVILKSIPHEKRGPLMPHRAVGRLMKGSPSTGFVIVFVLLGVIIALAIQSFSAQQQAKELQEQSERRDICVQQWGRNLVESVGVVSEANAKYRKRATARSDRLDDLLLGAIAQSEGRKEGSERTPQEQKVLDRAINRYQGAVESLRDTVNTFEQVKSDNPYPVLDC